MITVYVSIGNSDDKLAQADWSAYQAEVRDMLRAAATVIHGEWYSAPDSGYQNACFCAEFETGTSPAYAVLRGNLAALRSRYGQDSVAWAVAETEFI